MRIFVTGADGFVGARLVPRLLAAGHTPIATDVATVNVTDAGALERAVADARPDAVIHLAAVTFVPEASRNPDLTWKINVEGTRNLVHAIQSRAPRTRLLLIGSAEQYAATNSEADPISEEAELTGTSPYAESKTAAEALALEAAADGLELIRVRAFNHTGPGQSPVFVAPDFSRQVAMIQRGASPRIRVGNLESIRDILHVDDVVEAYLRLLEPDVPPGPYNVASGRGTKIGELLDILEELTGLDVNREGDPERWRPADARVGDSRRLMAATGWTPTKSIREIMSELLAYWGEQLAAEASAHDSSDARSQGSTE